MTRAQTEYAHRASYADSKDIGHWFATLAQWRVHFELEVVDAVRALAEMAGEP